MQIAVLTVTLRLAWAHSLKEKRREVKSLITRLRSKFNVSVCEAAAQDDHQTAVLAVAALAANAPQADAILAEVSRFIHAATDAEIVAEETELR